LRAASSVTLTLKYFFRGCQSTARALFTTNISLKARYQQRCESARQPDGADPPEKLGQLSNAGKPREGPLEKGQPL